MLRVCGAAAVFVAVAVAAVARAKKEGAIGVLRTNEQTEALARPSAPPPARSARRDVREFASQMSSSLAIVV